MVENQLNDLGILKSIWKKEGGRWVVHGLHGLDLKPREGFEKDFFKIHSEMELLTQRPGPVMQDLFSSFGETEFLLKQSIVPVVAWNEGDSEIRCIGTGFFISASGYLMTAAHVLRDPVHEKYAGITQIDDHSFQLDNSLRFGVAIPPNPAMKNAPFNLPTPVREAKIMIHPIEFAYHWGQDVEGPLFHQEPEFQYSFDIAVLKVKENPFGGGFQPLNIGAHRLNTGDQAVAIGYAEMTNIPINPNGGIGDFQHDLTVSVGEVKNIYLNNLEEKQNATPGPCFDFDAKIPGKMSGAPILVGSGILTKGVISRSWQDERHATGCLVAPIMQLKLHDEKSLIDLMEEGREGIPRLVGGDL